MVTGSHDQGSLYHELDRRSVQPRYEQAGGQHKMKRLPGWACCLAVILLTVIGLVFFSSPARSRAATSCSTTTWPRRQPGSLQGPEGKGGQMSGCQAGRPRIDQRPRRPILRRDAIRGRSPEMALLRESVPQLPSAVHVLGPGRGVDRLGRLIVIMETAVLHANAAPAVGTTALHGTPAASRYCGQVSLGDSMSSSSCPSKISIERSSSAPTSAGAPTPSPPAAARPGSASRSATRSTSGCAR